MDFGNLMLQNIVVIIVIITPSFNAILHKQYLLNFLLQSLILQN